MMNDISEITALETRQLLNLLRGYRDTRQVNRKTGRQNFKILKRKEAVIAKMRNLFKGCPASIVTTGYLSEGEFKFLIGQYIEAIERKFDYFPISKRINNKIREYAHYHPKSRNTLFDLLVKEAIDKQFQDLVGNAPELNWTPHIWYGSANSATGSTFSVLLQSW